MGAMMGSFADVRGVGVPSRLAAKGPGVPKPGHADIMATMHPDESAPQIRMQQTAVYFNTVVDQKLAGLNQLTQENRVDLLADGMMPERAVQQMTSTRLNQIAENKGYGDLGDTLDAKKIKELATRRHVPTPAQQLAFTLG